jgi:hypothetical protein
MARRAMNDLHAWATTLPSLHAEVWARLVRGVHDAKSPARRPALATVSPAGRPEVRTVVLRSADRGRGAVVVHTDVRSAKVTSLRQTPFAALHVWDPSAHLQLRLDATVSIQSGASVAPLWERLSAGARTSYGHQPAPGQPIADALAYTVEPDAGFFAVLTLEVEAIDAVHLGAPHRRARFERASGWAGQWLSP